MSRIWNAPSLAKNEFGNVYVIRLPPLRHAVQLTCSQDWECSAPSDKWLPSQHDHNAASCLDVWPTGCRISALKKRKNKEKINIFQTICLKKNISHFQTRSWRGRELFTYDLQQWHWAKCFPHLVFYFCLSVCRFVEGNVCRTFAHCYV